MRWCSVSNCQRVSSPIAGFHLASSALSSGSRRRCIQLLHTYPPLCLEPPSLASYWQWLVVTVPGSHRSVMSGSAAISARGDTLRPLPSKVEAFAHHAINAHSTTAVSASQQHREDDEDDTEEEEEAEYEESEEDEAADEEDDDEDELVYGATGGNLLNLDADAWDDTALIQLWDQHVRMYKVGILSHHRSPQHSPVRRPRQRLTHCSLLVCVVCESGSARTVSAASR